MDDRTRDDASYELSEDGSMGKVSDGHTICICQISDVQRFIGSVHNRCLGQRKSPFHVIVLNQAGLLMVSYSAQRDDSGGMKASIDFAIMGLDINQGPQKEVYVQPLRISKVTPEVMGNSVTNALTAEYFRFLRNADLDDSAAPVPMVTKQQERERSLIHRPMGAGGIVV